VIGFRDTYDPPGWHVVPRNPEIDLLGGDVSAGGQLAEIVQLSSDFSIAPQLPDNMDPLFYLMRLAELGIPNPYLPRPVEVEHLILSSLGATARLSSAWDYPTLREEVLTDFGMPVFSVEAWQHIASLGRDQYVRVVSKGFACWTGHRLSVLNVVERKFYVDGVVRTEERPAGNVAIFGSVGYLHFYQIVVVQEPEKAYHEYSDAYEFGGREMPFRKVRLTTLETPILDVEIDAQNPTWIHARGDDVQFGVIAEDWDGNQITFTTPLMFVPYSKDHGVPDPGTINNWYIGAAGTAVGVEALHSRPRNTVTLNKQQMSFAPSAGGTTENYLATSTVDIGLQIPPQLRPDLLPATYPPSFLPQMQRATAEIPAVNQLLGRNESVEISLATPFLEHGFEGENAKAEAFLEIPNGIGVQFAAETVGGLAKPDMRIEGLTRIMGAVPNMASVSAGMLDVGAFANASLLGGITIGDLLARDGPGTTISFDPAEFAASMLAPNALLDPNVHLKVPMLTTRRTSSAVETRYLWKPVIRDFGPLKTEEGLEENGFPDRGAQLILDALLTTPLDGAPPTYRVTGRFLNFALDFAEVLKVTFAELSFASQDGKKPDVSAEGVELRFQGPLEFVNTLRDILPANGFSDPPFVNVDTAGIVAGYSLGVPNVGVGIFSIQNIALSATLSVPFVDKPAAVRFAISERHNPFLVTVALFGGGGFFGLEVSTRGLEQIEASIEFGGNISLNLGVASGGVYVMAGIYFSMTNQSVELTGYLRCGGYLEVLGLISISVEFHLSFTYLNKTPGGGEAWGQASLTVCVEVLCFSKSVTLTVERRFAGAAGDPAFDEMVEPSDWADYCLAFA
jgi:hypothetical protein